MSWYVFWILELSPKEASGDSEDKLTQEENSNGNKVSWRVDEDDTGSCCGNGSDDDDGKTAAVCSYWVFSKSKEECRQQHMGEVINSKNNSVSVSVSEGEQMELVADSEARQRRLQEESKDFWDACIAHGY